MKVFQVDLSGMIDLLSSHLYSGPSVYIRELLQNGVDAITARRDVEPNSPASIKISTGVTSEGKPTVVVVDTGIGLTFDEANELLATIGRSSKRLSEGTEIAQDFIGQFGIGLLAAFLVADEIQVVSRSVREGSSSILWRGFSNGTFEISETSATAENYEIGTRVTLVARADMEHWFDSLTVAKLAKDYGSLLPFDVSVQVPLKGREKVWQRISAKHLPWLNQAGTLLDNSARLNSSTARRLLASPH